VFQVAGSRLRNSLPPDVTSALTQTVFRNRLKTHLFSRSFPSCFRFLVLYLVYNSGLAVLYLATELTIGHILWSVTHVTHQSAYPWPAWPTTHDPVPDHGMSRSRLLTNHDEFTTITFCSLQSGINAMGDWALLSK